MAVQVIHEIILLYLSVIIAESATICSHCQLTRSSMVCACADAGEFPVCARLDQCEAVCRGWVIDDNRCRLEGQKLVLSRGNNNIRSGRTLSFMNLIGGETTASNGNVFKMWHKVIEWVMVPPGLTGTRAATMSNKQEKYLDKLYKSTIAVLKMAG